MRLNPEFRRYLWLELSAQRLIAMPIVLVAVFWLSWLTSMDPLKAVASAALILFYLGTLVWGSRLAANAVVSEVREATWDWQRMSAIRPWQMTWGKLFGSTVFVWFGGLICLVIFAIASVLAGHGAQLPSELLAVLMIGLLAQAVALAASLLWLRKVEPSARAAVLTPQALGLLAGFLAAFLWGDWAFLPIDIWEPGGWYGLLLDPRLFFLLSLAAFLGWSLLAAGRLMQAELQVRQLPWAWPAFTLFLMAYLQGFRPQLCPGCGESAAGNLLIPFLVGVALAYVALFIFPKRAVALRALSLAVRQAAWGRALRALPLWLIAAAFAFVVGLALAAAFWWDLSLPPSASAAAGQALLRDAALVALAILAFLIRDLAIVVLLNLGGRVWRGDMAAGIYLLLLHVIAPGILAATLEVQWSGLLSGFTGLGLIFAGPSVGLGLPGDLGLFVDLDLGDLPEIALASAVIQVVLLLLLLWRQWAGFQAAFAKRLPVAG